MRFSRQVMEHYSAIKKNKIKPFAAAWMGLEIIILNKVRQKEKDRNLLCGPVVKIPCLNCREHGFNPWSGN